MMKIIAYLLFMFSFFTVFSRTTYTDQDPIIRDCAEQIEYLIDFNKNNISKGVSDKNWYVYFLGKNKEYLQAYLSYHNYKEDSNEELENIFIEDITIDKEYLEKLNNRLVAINKSEKLEVYVAFIGSKREIIQPLMPKKINTLHKGRVFIDSLINYSDKSYKGFDLERAKQEGEKYVKDFSAKMERIYEQSKMANKSDKPNHIMPFSHRTIRHIYNKEGTKETKQKWAISLYLGKTEKRFNYSAFRKIYREKEGYGQDPVFQKIAKQVMAVEEYFSLDIPPPDQNEEDCHDLLVMYMNKPIMTEFPSFRQLAMRNPCILKNVTSWGDDIEKSEWMKELEIMIVTPLYAAILAPVAAEFFIPSVVELMTVERAANMSKAMTVAMVIETAMLHYWTGNPAQKNDVGQAMLGINPVNVVYEGVKALAEAPFVIELSVDCIYNGTQMGEAIRNPENFKPDWKTKECVKGVIISVLTKIGLNQGGQFFKTLKRLAKEDPDVFIQGWARVWKDIRVDQKDSFIDMSYGIFKELGIPSHKIDGVINKLKLKIEKLKNDVTNSNSDEITTNDVVEDTPNNQGNSIDSATILEGWKSVLGKRIEDVVDAPKGYEFYVGATGKKLIRKIKGSDVPSLSAKDGTIRYAKGLQGLLEDEFQNIFKEYSGWDTVWKKKFLKDFDNQWSMLDHLNKNKDLIDGWKNFRHKYGNEIICTK